LPVAAFEHCCSDDAGDIVVAFVVDVVVFAAGFVAEVVDVDVFEEAWVNLIDLIVAAHGDDAVDAVVEKLHQKVQV
jgi:hypothetical protein